MHLLALQRALAWLQYAVIHGVRMESVDTTSHASMLATKRNFAVYRSHWYLLKLHKDQSVHQVVETLQRRFDEILFARLLENNALTQIFNAETI